MQAGHPCYFVGFSPNPEPGQTIETVIEAWAVFMRKVTELHSNADGKPVVIGNCQAGWALMMLAAKYPELCGPIIVAGSPISYWGGVHGIYPMRYTGGMLGGSWLDGAHQRYRKREVRRRLAGAELWKISTRPTPFGLNNTMYTLTSTPRDPVIWDSNAGGGPCPFNRRGNSIHRRQPLRRQQA